MHHRFALVILINIIFYANSYAQSVATQTESLLQNKMYANRTASLGIIGDTAEVRTRTKTGVVLMGGGKDVDAAFKWMIGKSGGGNVVIIRASGTNAFIQK